MGSSFHVETQAMHHVQRKHTARCANATYHGGGGDVVRMQPMVLSTGNTVVGEVVHHVISMNTCSVLVLLYFRLPAACPSLVVVTCEIQGAFARADVEPCSSLDNNLTPPRAVSAWPAA